MMYLSVWIEKSYTVSLLTSPTEGTRSLKYRPEIDGLRAIAVIPVIFFHAGLNIFSGGFVGVDVFFVISGYLITTLLIEDIQGGHFSIVRFYERRARRILPALFFVMLCCMPFAWAWMLPVEMRDFSESLIAVSLFGSNILFWQESGYFQSAAELKPLLHTWSLAVEEQYYVVFPLFLMFTWSIGKNRVLLLVLGLVLISFLLGEWGWRYKPDANFYLAPTRAWELLVGSITAFFVQRRGVRANNTLSLSGLGLILIAIFTYTDETPFPSYFAIVPVLGVALLVLFASKQTIAGRILSSRPLVLIGLLSYSAYLWHQPLLAFARIRYTGEAIEILMIALSVAAIGLGYLSWRYIEKPFRNSSFLSRNRVFAMYILGSLFFVGIGAYGHFSSGKNIRSENLAKGFLLQNRLSSNQGLHPDCSGNNPDLLMNCQTTDQPRVLVWGDSYAMHLVDGIKASSGQIGLAQRTQSVCGPILDIAPLNSRYPKAWGEKCIENNDRVIDYLERSAGITHVVMSSPYMGYVGQEKTVLLRDGTTTLGVHVTKSALLKTIARIKELGKTPIIVSPTPQDGSDIGKCLVRAELFHAALSNCDLIFNKGDYGNQLAFDLLESVEESVNVIWLDDYLCSNRRCSAALNSVFIYRDHGHLSKEGGRYVAKLIGYRQVLNDAGDLL
ncbi:acyltransferase family protein [Congregibacter variabilis]|uniref:Acyltransferase family protein n=1 Tax=Congregibacter variabilis TaxID=3081200 RepID=A0ABZ0I8Z7_9GAMM|nr:acyltransferase family protein [Congregibacter sp. IMCC43200]